MCGPELTPSSADVALLVSSIERGARCELGLAFDLLHVLGGGNLEDVMRALSGLAGTEPRLLLEMLSRNAWDATEIRQLMRMLPLTTVDNPDEKLRVIRQRIRALRQVEEPALAVARASALNALGEYEAQLEKK